MIFCAAVLVDRWEERPDQHRLRNARCCADLGCVTLGGHERIPSCFASSFLDGTSATAEIHFDDSTEV